MANNINIGVDIKTKYEEQLGKVKDINRKLSEKGGYEGAGGQERLNKVNNLITSVEKALSSGVLSYEELTKLKNDFKELFRVLDLVSNSVVQLTPDMEKLKKSVDKAHQELEEASKNRSEIVSRGKLSEDEKSFVNIEGFNERVKQIGAYRVTKDNTLYKKSMSDFETVYKRIQNKEDIRTADGRSLADTEEWKEMIQIQENYNKDLKDADDVLKQKIAAEKRAITNLEKQATKEKSEGITGNDITVDLVDTNSQTSELTDSLYKVKAAQIGVEKTTTALNSSINRQQSALTKAFKAFTIYNVVIKSAKKALREAVTTIKDLDKYLTEQAMVTGKTRKETYALVSEYQKLAKETGATTKEIASVATEYMKQGKTIKESLTLTKAAVSAAKVARVSVGDSVNYLTTALNGFRLSANDAMLVSDKFAAVAASSATDYDELAIALSKVASQANLAGMSIDYTTALLTKGLETTREAPETMGTALKTIIARMRELGDYGETLEDGTDINNVESQLAYVGIALRDQQGELRSTEEVLDELGKKWDTLDKNQQAAVAKALAGTRQQSRLIAMMEDYERVTELQEIAQRSQGATLAQSATYLEGIEASLNRVSVAWEKVITTLTSSDLIISFIDSFAYVLDKFGSFLDTTMGSIGLITTLTIVVTGVLSKRQIEHQIMKDQYKLQQQQLLLEKKKQKDLYEETHLKEALLKVSRAEAAVTAADLKLQQAKTKMEIAEKNNDMSAFYQAQAEAADAQFALAKAQEQSTIATNELKEARAKLMKDDLQYKTMVDDINYAENKHGGILSNNIRVMALMNTITAISTLWKKISKKTTDSETGAVNLNTKAKILNKIVTLGLIALAAAAVVAIGAFVVSLFKSESATERASKKIKKLSNEIYKLNESKNSIASVTSEIERLDGKLIKTNKDLEEMQTLLEGASENVDFTRGGKFSDEEAETRKANFEALSAQQKINWLKEEELAIEESIRKKRQQQLDQFKKDDVKPKKLLEDPEIASAVYATNNAYLYDQIDALKETGKYTDEQLAATEKIGQAILENLSAEQALEWAQSKQSEELAKHLNSMGDIKIDGELVSLVEALTSDDYELKDRVNAFETIAETLSGESLEAFKGAYNDLWDFSQNFSDNALDLITNLGLTTDEINNLADAMKKLGVEEQLVSERLERLITLTGNGVSIKSAIGSVFADELSGLSQDEYDKAYKTILNAYIDATAAGVNNMGQQIDKMQNKINNFYEKASKWNEMTANEQAEFIADNAELFQGDAGLLKAFESGDYTKIEDALKNSDTLAKQREALVKQLQIDLDAENAKAFDDQNAAYKKYLEEQIEYWSDSENIWKASLKTLLDQEKAQLDDYKSYLQDKQKAEEDSLNKRKEAYEKYFNSIKEQEEDIEFDEQLDLLTTNLSKLGSSTDANAMNQKKELENQIKELEEERLKDLRERAQEAIIQNIDDEISEINEKFDKLLESNRALLAAMTGELQDSGSYVSNMLANRISQGDTALNLNDYIQTLGSTFGGKIGDIDLNDISVKEENNNLYLTVNGKDVLLDTSSQQSVYDAIYKALREVGGI